MSEPLVSQITSVVWHDARKEKPSLVQDFVCRNFKYLNDNELKVMVDDINFAERINQLGDERIDKPGWLKFREKINSELESRKAEQNA